MVCCVAQLYVVVKKGKEYEMLESAMKFVFLILWMIPSVFCVEDAILSFKKGKYRSFGFYITLWVFIVINICKLAVIH